MRLPLGLLKNIIHEQLFSDMMRNAGTVGAGGISSPHKGNNMPPPGLGSPEDEDDLESDKEPQKKSQLAVRAGDRLGR